MGVAHLTPVLLFAAAVYLMMFAGVQKRALEWKRRSRTCPSCGRDDRRCRCRS
jgi:hypothetical protein